MIPMIKKDSYWHGAVSWILPALWTGFVLGIWVAGGEHKVFGYAMLLYLPVFILQQLVQALIKKYGQQQASTSPQDHAGNPTTGSQPC